MFHLWLRKDLIYFLLAHMYGGNILFNCFICNPFIKVLSRNARFEQIWRSRKAKKDALEDEAIYEMCQLYDVVRVDIQEDEVEAQKEKY